MKIKNYFLFYEIYFGDFIDDTLIVILIPLEAKKIENMKSFVLNNYESKVSDMYIECVKLVDMKYQNQFGMLNFFKY